MMNSLTPFLGSLAALFGVAGYIPYFIAMWRRTTKPHVFSWFIWGLLTGIAFIAQISAGAGPGAWVTGITAVFCLLIAAIAWKRRDDIAITRSDWWALSGGLLAIPAWLATSDPLYAVVIITVIDAVAFYPTFRKTWYAPADESLSTYTLSGTKWLLAFPALETFNMTTALYPASLVVMNFAFVGMAFWRRYVLKKASTLPFPG